MSDRFMFVLIALFVTGTTVVAETHVGGLISDDAVWDVAGSPYIVDQTIQVYGSANPRLTVAAGVEVRFTTGTSLQVAQYYNYDGTSYRGQLEAVGTADSLITFTSESGSTDGWSGLQFFNASDYSGSLSNLRYCVIEKSGNARGVYCSSTGQPSISHCEIRDITGDGIELTNYSPIAIDSTRIYNCTGEGIQTVLSNVTLDSVRVYDNLGHGLYFDRYSPQVDNCEIFGNGLTGIYATSASLSVDQSWVHDNGSHGVQNNAASALVVSNCTIEDNVGYPIRSTGLLPLELTDNIYLNNQEEMIGWSGQVSEDTHYRPYEIPVKILGTIDVYGPNNPKLTIDPSMTLAFPVGAALRIAQYYNYDGTSYRGQLEAVGTADSLITFTSESGSTDGWSGLQFFNASDYSGSLSNLRYCVIEKSGAGGQANIQCTNTNQPVINDCIISESGADGLRFTSSLLDIHSTRFIANTGNGCYSNNSALTVIGDTTGAGNCFIDNGLYDLYNAGTGEIFARNNFWNQPDSIGIAARVYDFSDNANRGAVLFTPFLVDCPYDLAPVNDLQIVVIDETVHLSWSAIPDADYYRIYSTSDLNDTFILLDESATSNYSFGLPVPSGIHFYQVTAVQNSQ